MHDKPFRKKLLSIDLTEKTYKKIEVNENDYRNYLGGSGLAIHYLLDYPIPVNPLSQEAPLVIMSGLLTGTNFPTSCKFNICARSPLTGIWGEGTGGGYFGSEIKATGYDGFIITGKAEKPLYLYITEESVSFSDASHVWGKDTYKTSEIIKAETDKRTQVLSIGLAGEKQSLLATAIIGGRASRAVGRGGLGAIFGSKNLKAVALLGGNRKRIDNPLLKDLIRGEMKFFREATKDFGAFGTAGAVEVCELRGSLPIKNWQLGNWEEGAQKTSNQTMMKSMFKRHYSCHSCPIHCGKVFSLDGKEEFHGAEYETVAGFGANCLIDDEKAIARANDFCNRMGLDTISSSMAVSFIFEAYEKGLITVNRGDPEPSWGDGESMLHLLELIAKREGIGEVLADGTARAAAFIGNGSEEFTLCVKNMELPMHDPRAFHSMGCNYATANRGACHLESLGYSLESGLPFPEIGYPANTVIDPHSSEGKGKMCYDLQNFLSIFNPLGICKFLLKGSTSVDRFVDWVNVATGWDMDAKEMLSAGEKIFNMKRIYNCALGVDRSHDTLPHRILHSNRNEGVSANSIPNLERMLNEYYKCRGWTENGIPSKEIIEKYSLQEYSNQF
jgi:aldehyde:ferredoxin oxidoreductase